MEENLSLSQYRIRMYIGILGLSLPVLLLLIQQDLLSSISHYYYTSASVFFIGILFAFGIILLSYEGYEITESENISDDHITSLAAMFIFITVLVPTKCEESGGEILFCDGGYLFGHHSIFKSTIHYVSAGCFLAALGYICVYKFALSRDTKKQKFYKVCGYIVWACIGLIAILFAAEEFILHHSFNEYLMGFTFILETIAVWAFGIAWVVKGIKYKPSAYV